MMGVKIDQQNRVCLRLSVGVLAHKNGCECEV